ncbi:MAG: imidazole glycerol phosphate synthase subunit HisH [Gammaproteobacteria bacterium]|nr:imidazole glycerol phosphate synthase subunit HisH [Gammaproteobacteria bacterium]
MQTVAVIDYGGSNLRSVAKALESVAAAGTRIVVSAEPGTIRDAHRVVFPGQGAIGACMDGLRAHGLDAIVTAAIASGRPFLGICLGLQTLMRASAEDGGTDGLGIVPGHVVRFADALRDPATGARLKVPHMGWNRVRAVHPHALWDGIAARSRFYFVHSYYVVPEDPADIAAVTDYGFEFVCAIARDNVFATQFHPEKSQRSGLRLLANFLAWNARG